MLIIKYLGRKILAKTFVISAVLLCIVLGGRLSHFLEKALSENIPYELLLSMIFWRIPGVLELVLPLGWTVSTLLVIGHMREERELLAIFAAGISEWKMIFYLTLPGVVVALIVGFFSVILSPDVAGYLRAEIEHQNKLTAFDGIRAREFRIENNGRMIFAESVSTNKKKLENVIMIEPGDSGRHERIFVGEQVDQEFINGRRNLIIWEGLRYSGKGSSPGWEVIKFDKYTMPMTDETTETFKELETLGIRELLAKDNPSAISIVQWRISVFLACLVMLPWVFLIAKGKNTFEIYLWIPPLIIFQLGYVTSLTIMRNSIATEDIPSSPGLFAVHAIVFGFGCVVVLLNSTKRKIFF